MLEQVKAECQSGRFGRAHAQGSECRFGHNEKSTMMQRASTIALALAMLTGPALGQSTPPSGSIRGVVFTTEQDHAHSVVTGTNLSLDGASHLEAESDSQGVFVFSTVPVGSYTITAQSPGLTARQR